MHIDLYITPVGVKEMSLQDKGVIVVDILRAGTTICRALLSGCKEIVPVETVEQAMALAGSLFRDTILLCGEREGKIVPGFDLGNSPMEYTAKRVKNQSLIFTTSNGTAALVKAQRAGRVVIGGFVNCSNIINTLVKWERDIAILCSGSNGRMSLEDTVAGGMFVKRLVEHFGNKVTLTDTAHAAQILYEQFADSLVKMVKNTVHGKYLQSIDFAEDVEYCAKVDSLEIVPILINKTIVRLDEKER